MSQRDMYSFIEKRPYSGNDSGLHGQGFRALIGRLQSSFWHEFELSLSEIILYAIWFSLIIIIELYQDGQIQCQLSNIWSD